jgi:hypothetical protein
VDLQNLCRWGSRASDLRRIQGIATTTHVDLQGEAMPLSALEDFAWEIRECYIPAGVEHDIRNPPVGRIVSGEVVRLPDGEYGLLVTQELYESTDTASDLAGDGRRMVTSCRETRGLAVMYDRTFDTEAGRTLLADLSSLMEGQEPPRPDFKKALEPIPTLILGAGMFLLGGVASGFLSRIGSDAYDNLKAVLRRYLSTEKPSERIFDFCMYVRAPRGEMEVHVLLTNPSPDELAGVLDASLASMDELLARLPVDKMDIARVVCQAGKDGPHLLYIVRGDAVPWQLGESRRE